MSESSIAPLDASALLRRALLTSYGRLDVMQWIPGAEDYERLRERAVAIDVPGAGVIRFAGHDDLVAMKRAAGRPEDRLDLQRLAEARGR